MKRIFALTVAILMVTNIITVSYAKPTASSSSLRQEALSIDNLKLKGTLFARDLKPLAIIEDTSCGKIMMYELGDKIGESLEITSINRGEVIFRDGKDEFVLSLPAGGIAQPLSDTIKTADDKKWYKVSRQGNTFTVDEATVTNCVLRMKDIAKGVKVEPFSINGKTSGIRVSKLNRTGILKEIGVEEGDVIKTINGYTLNSPYQIFNAYKNLKNRQDMTVDIIRGNKPIVLTYRIQK